MCLLGENTDPFLRSILDNEEGMFAIAILAGEAPVIVLGRIIVGPHIVDSVLVEEGFPGTLTESDYSKMALISEG
jgi:hypothetical protein